MVAVRGLRYYITVFVILAVTPPTSDNCQDNRYLVRSILSLPNHNFLSLALESVWLHLTLGPCKHTFTLYDFIVVSVVCCVILSRNVFHLLNSTLVLSLLLQCSAVCFEIHASSLETDSELSQHKLIFILWTAMKVRQQSNFTFT